MDFDFRKVVKTVKDELYEMKHCRVVVRTPYFDVEEFDKMEEKALPHVASVSSAISKDRLDENGNPLVIYRITIYQNPDDIDMKRKKDKRMDLGRIRVMDYLNNMGIPMNYKSEFIMKLLHEYGHIKLIDTFRYYGRYDEYKEFRKVHDNIVQLALGHKNMIKHLKDTSGVDLFYNLSVSELNADNFMYINFPRVWNRLKNEGLV